jgi:aminopeptidase-like protein
MVVTASTMQQRMRDYIETFYLLNRVPVSDETSFFARETVRRLGPGARLLSLPTGTECLTWSVPLKWSVREAYIEAPDGTRLADYRTHPIVLKSYSAPFDGTVSKEELLRHVAVHPELDDRLVYDNRWQYHQPPHTEWGFALPKLIAERLPEGDYRVRIDVSFEQGCLDIIDWTLPGNSAETVFFAAHTCHPGQVNDGIACIAVLIELFRYLEQLTERTYTFRMILGPEYYAAAGLLQYGTGVEHLKYGYFLDMMGNPNPVSFSRSFRGDTYVDNVTRTALGEQEEPYTEAPYRGLYGNDEMFYDGPGFEIPTIGLSRYPFRYYHSDYDDPAHCDFAKLEESVRLLQRIVHIFETDCVPTLTYKGPLYLSKYQLYIDPKVNRRGYESLQEMQILMDGRKSCLDIAKAIGADYSFVRSFVGELCRHRLAEVSPVAAGPSTPQAYRPALEVLP